MVNNSATCLIVKQTAKSLMVGRKTKQKLKICFLFQVCDEREMPHLPAQNRPRKNVALRRMRPRSPHVLPQAKAQVNKTNWSD